MGKRENKHYTCGVCDALAAGYGVLARSMLSRDAVYLSLLTCAQMEGTMNPGCVAGMRPERKCRPWSRARPAAPEFTYPAAASVAAYCGLLMDRLHDEPSFAASAQYALCRKRMMAADSRLKGFGLDLPMERLVAKQHTAEAGRGQGFSSVTEEICSALFSHSAVVAGVPANAPGLAEVGRNVGRIAYLIDGYVDAESDLKIGSFNACSAMASALGLSGTGRIREEVESRAEASLGAINRAMSDVRLSSHSAQIRHSLTEGLRARVAALMSLGAMARSRPKQYYLFSLAPVAIFMVKGLVSPSADDYCCSSDCLTCGITEEDCCGAALPPGTDVPAGVVATAGLGGVGAVVGAGVGILASGIGWPSAPAGSGPGATTDVTSAQASAPPPEFMQQWGSPPPGTAQPGSPYGRHNWIDWRDDWYDVSEENQRIQRGITPGEELREILENRPAWMKDYEYVSPNDSEFDRKYGTARYLTPDQVDKLPPDKRAEYNSWKERYASWQRRHIPPEPNPESGASRG